MCSVWLYTVADQRQNKINSVQTHQCETVDFTILLHAYLVLTLNTTLNAEYVKRLVHTVVCIVCLKNWIFFFASAYLTRRLLVQS
jgi:hypothetical protein